MNKVFLIGRLSRDPELRHTTGGTAVCQINVAISRPVASGNEPQTDFINVVVWNKQAENVARYLSKGRQIAIEGRIQTRNYDNAEGKRTYVTEVIASNVEFLGSKNSANNSNSKKDNDEPIGFVSACEIEPSVYGDVGIVIGENYVHQGYGSEVLSELIKYIKSINKMYNNIGATENLEMVGVIAVLVMIAVFALTA